MATIDGNRVNDDCYRALSSARKLGVPFKLNDGWRTIAEQWDRWNTYQRNGHPVAAYPTSNAPHIKKNHAVDVDTFHPANGAEKVRQFCNKRGMNLQYTVRGEAWHLGPVNCTWADFKLTKVDKLRLEAQRIRAKARKSGWKDYYKRRIESIDKYLRRHK